MTNDGKQRILDKLAALSWSIPAKNLMRTTSSVKKGDSHFVKKIQKELVKWRKAKQGLRAA
jgi:hypothetical protein